MTWNLNDLAAQLDSGLLTADVDIAQPQRGLCNLHVNGAPLSAMKILRIESATGRVAKHLADAPIEDRYARGPDLVATYAESPDDPLRIQIYWSEIATGEYASARAVVRLVVSVQTSDWNYSPDLCSTSLFPTGEFLTWHNKNGGSQTAADSFSAMNKRDEQRPTDLILFRIPGTKFSYAEMIHPVDSLCSAASFKASQTSSGDDDRVHFSHRLFAGQLEKGVILRTRILSVILDRENDEQAALDCYHHFAASEPQLTV